MSGIQVCVAFYADSLHSQLGFLHVVIGPLCEAPMVLRIQPSALCMLDKWASIPPTARIEGLGSQLELMAYSSLPLCYSVKTLTKSISRGLERWLRG